ncbi:MAG: hypothetical protein RIQ89_1652 [Bacteroidota bacterium]
MKNFNTIVLLLLFLIGNNKSDGQIALTQIANGFVDPVDIQHCGDGRLFVVQQNGFIRIIDSTGAVLPTPFLNVTNKVAYGGERGLLGMAFDPNYATNGYFYIAYTGTGGGNNRVSRYSVSAGNPNKADSLSGVVVISIFDPYSNHNGGDLAFSPKDGYLYYGTGDGGSANDPQNRAQNKDSLLGKMLRLDVGSGIATYQIPPTNPLVGAAGRDEIWATGLRNPWRFSFDRLTADLWIGDVGQGAWEEVNLQLADATTGGNYGWRCYEANANFNTSGCQAASNYDAPLLGISHNDGSCSVIGGYVYRGAEFASLWGEYFFTDYCYDNIKSLKKDTAGNYILTAYGTSFPGGAYEYSGWGEDVYGEMYLASLAGQIYKLSSTDTTPVAYISDQDTLLLCEGNAVLQTPRGRGFTYDWTLNGTSLGVNSYQIIPTVGGLYQVTAYNSNFESAISTPVLVILNSNPVVSLQGIDTLYCEYNAGIVLNGNPSGGIFTIDGAVADSLNPATLGLGNHLLNYVFTDLNGCSGADQVNFVIDECLSVNDNYLAASASVFPNPNRGHFQIRFSNFESTAMITLTDIAGRILYSEAHNGNQGTQIATINLPLAAGYYFLTIRNKIHSTTMRFEVQ